MYAHRACRLGPRSPSAVKCPICERYGFETPKDRGSSDHPELGSNPRNPVFVNHAALLIGPVDVDGLLEGSQNRDSATRQEATLHMKTVISSVLRSQSFSPVERVDIVRDTRAFLAQEYHLPGSVFDGILSKAFDSLDALTPLEFEILHWSPIWEGSGDEGADLAMIRFLIEHWKHSYTTNEYEGSDRSSSEDTTDPRSALVQIVRRACLRRIDPETSELDEDTANKLFQRILMIVSSYNTGTENHPPGMERRPNHVGAMNSRVSVAYKPRLMDTSANMLRSSIDRANTLGHIEFAALISIGNFLGQLNAYGGENALTAGTPTAWQAGSERYQGGVLVVNRRVPGLRYHPYGNRHAGQNSQQVEASTLIPAEPNPFPMVRVTPVPSRLLFVDFIAACRGWTIAIGRNELRLCIHEEESPDKSQSGFGQEQACTDSTSGLMSNVCAEVRLVPPQTDASSDEHVFTFADIHVPCGTMTDKDGNVRTARVSPCFSSDSAATPRREDTLIVSGFDDPRLLHADELLLELRVRIQKSPVELSAHQAGSIVAHASPDASAYIDTSSWSEELLAPPTSESPSGIVSIHESDARTEPSSFKSTDRVGSSWIEI